MLGDIFFISIGERKNEITMPLKVDKKHLTLLPKINPTLP